MHYFFKAQMSSASVPGDVGLSCKQTTVIKMVTGIDTEVEIKGGGGDKGGGGGTTTKISRGTDKSRVYFRLIE